MAEWCHGLPFGQGAKSGRPEVRSAPVVAVRIVSRRATASDPVILKWYANGQKIFSYTDPAPCQAGRFAIRTATSHWQLKHFSVVAPGS